MPVESTKRAWKSEGPHPIVRHLEVEPGQPLVRRVCGHTYHVSWENEAYSLPMDDLRSVIDELWSRRDALDAADPAVSGPILQAVGLLDSGAARVAEIIDDTVVVPP